jgi:hypothetical protein
MAVVKGEVHGCFPVGPWESRVSTEGQEHSGGMHSQRVAALQGAIAFRVNGVRQECHVVAYLIGVDTFRRRFLWLR